MNKLKLWISSNTDYNYCYKCKHFARNPKRAKFEKNIKFKWLSPSYWKFILEKLDTKKEGLCLITAIDKAGDHQNFIMRGNESCIFDGYEKYIQDTKSFRKKDQENERSQQKSPSS